MLYNGHGIKHATVQKWHVPLMSIYDDLYKWEGPPGVPKVILVVHNTISWYQISRYRVSELES